MERWSHIGFYQGETVNLIPGAFSGLVEGEKALETRLRDETRGICT